MAWHRGLPDEEAALDEAVRAAAARRGCARRRLGRDDRERGFDRENLRLPGRQDELIERVSAANPRTVVVVNAGMPVLMPWAGQVAAVLYAWLPGQAMGEALADVLLGRAEPGGRLPVTMPVREADCPVLRAVPVEGRLGYDEGLLIGYRGYDAAGTAPLVPFGHGLGYTTWSMSCWRPGARPGPGATSDSVTVRNTGDRPGREVVEAYVAGPAADGRPVRVLGAFGGELPGPAHRAGDAHAPARVFGRDDTETAQWTWPSGEFTVAVGRSSRDLRPHTGVALP